MNFPLKIKNHVHIHRLYICVFMYIKAINRNFNVITFACCIIKARCISFHTSQYWKM